MMVSIMHKIVFIAILILLGTLILEITNAMKANIDTEQISLSAVAYELKNGLKTNSYE
ncbi:MAG: hypothetical protein KDC09_15325 [Bacteroidales bacterium]|nr:hypothetical protein [Bacteroidales bacterium]